MVVVIVFIDSMRFPIPKYYFIARVIWENNQSERNVCKGSVSGRRNTFTLLFFFIFFFTLETATDSYSLLYSSVICIQAARIRAEGVRRPSTDNSRNGSAAGRRSP